MIHKDLTGQKFGKLLVVEQLPHTEKYYKYKCLCDCGNTVEVKCANLKSGRVKSCGCLRRVPPNRSTDREDAILKREYSAIKKRHRKFKSNEDVITYNEFKTIVKSPCYFCGAECSKTIHDRLWSRKKAYKCSDITICVNGIDRIDSTKGYTSENCVACCKICNYAKNTMTIEEFKEWIEKVYDHLIKINDNQLIV